MVPLVGQKRLRVKTDDSNFLDEHFSPLNKPVNKRRITDKGTDGENGTDQ